MASDYGLNFGFRRSDEAYRVAEGRQRTPKTGTLLQGTAVTMDFDNPGYMRVASATDEPETGVTGLVIQELAWDVSIHEAGVRTSRDLNRVKNDRLGVITNGAGAKVWWRNTPAETRIDGFQSPAVTMVDFTGLEPGSLLGWDGTKFVVTTDASLAYARAITVDSTRQRVEATLLH